MTSHVSLIVIGSTGHLKKRSRFVKILGYVVSMVPSLSKIHNKGLFMIHLYFKVTELEGNVEVHTAGKILKN